MPTSEYGTFLDGSGSIGAEELSNATRQLGMDATQEELDKLIEEIDQDGNGEIDFEFCSCMKRISQKKVSWDEIIRQCFTVFDYVSFYRTLLN